ncbi:hypothetical protein A3E39_02415 [Candidatus Uhrbacteria bacterium RIFCSPHIGHO2_12_FULL_60_25]|uniref:DUF8128 domain-containing protein n=1 Tax=Candidatus Uhrbacteria bacterium RIFCSPHIGHO2_12_FULL_60_25 TaxID=1802399 RepID=A0A1F7ULC1_9BACT|nr:MAG: hypothetical protein A3D73_00480 [Candidatus Uhrbacteria bacterium RIFCSPHIGHO2_02_FULL_60_44]OGL79076.1 MAG: hypothetical protein A3E39_02415 [Candidatus Uhrbacteria bacterium RIFCSPHIGHO2_12_FULL_60_25]
MVMEDFLNVFNINLAAWVAEVGDNPLQAMWALFASWGWIILLWALLYIARGMWLFKKQSKYAMARTWVLLAVDVPKATEQTVKAVENMFAHLAGAHSPPTFMEKWWNGQLQDTISCEIISIEGHIQYLLRTTRKLRDLVEASLYAQYPDAEITEVEDYTLKIPTNYPNEQYECFGLEMMPARGYAYDVYPLKTYMDFEHQLTGEFKDPLAVLLEAFGRLGPGEQAWYQIILTPIAQNDYVAKAVKEIKKITGQKAEVKPTMLDKALDLPMQGLGLVGDVMFGAAEGAPKKPENALNSRMWNLTPGERKVVESIEKKMSKIVFGVKIRFLYVAKKEVFVKSKILQSFIGAIKQYNTNDMGSLKLETKRVGVSSALLFFKARRNSVRKERLIRAYRARTDWAGLKRFHLATDEIASLWHLPVSLFVKAPQVKKTESKKSEPPINLPFA